MTGERGLLLDTHVWLWAAEGSGRLPGHIAEAIAASPPHLSPVSIWETGLLLARRRIQLDRPLREWVETTMQRMPTVAAPLTHEVAIVCDELDTEHRDPADRMLAATALVYDLTLATVDERLTRIAWLPTLAI